MQPPIHCEHPVNLFITPSLCVFGKTRQGQCIHDLNTQRYKVLQLRRKSQFDGY